MAEGGLLLGHLPKEGLLSPQEQWLLDYHRRSQREGKYRINPGGSTTTVYIGAVGLPDGRIAMVPLYDQDTGRFMTEQEAAAKFMRDIAEGRAPIDTSGQAHNARAKRIHGQIESDGSVLRMAPQTPYDFRTWMGNMGMIANGLYNAF